MSNLRTRREHELLGGSPWEALDEDFREVFPVPSAQTPVEAPDVDETEQGVDTPSLYPPENTGSSTVEPWWAQQDLDLHWIESQQQMMGQDDETDSRDPQEFK